MAFRKRQTISVSTEYPGDFPLLFNISISADFSTVGPYTAPDPAEMQVRDVWVSQRDSEIVSWRNLDGLDDQFPILLTQMVNFSECDISRGGKMSDLITILSGVLRELRHSRGHTQIVASEKTGLSPSYISELENRKRRVTLTVLDRYAAAYDITVSSLVSRAETSRVDFSSHSLISSRNLNIEPKD